MSSNSFPEPMQRLRELRQVLLRLHKALLFSERAVYEQFYGRVQSSGEFFRLVTEHDWFSWLRPISQLIVQMDDLLFAREAIPSHTPTELINQARQLLQPAKEGTVLERRYYRAIQRDPDIALMHAEVSQLLNANP